MALVVVVYRMERGRVRGWWAGTRKVMATTGLSERMRAMVSFFALCPVLGTEHHKVVQRDVHVWEHVVYEGGLRVVD